MKSTNRITDAELEIMRILWREKRPVDYSFLRAELKELKGWEKTTISTLLKRLCDKGVVGVDRREVMYYTPVLAETEYMQTEEQAMLDKLYGGSAKSLVAALCRRGKLSVEDIDELRAFFSVEGGEQ